MTDPDVVAHVCELAGVDGLRVWLEYAEIAGKNPDRTAFVSRVRCADLHRWPKRRVSLALRALTKAGVIEPVSNNPLYYRFSIVIRGVRQERGAGTLEP